MHLSHDPSIPAAPQIDFNQFLAVDIRSVCRMAHGCFSW